MGFFSRTNETRAFSLLDYLTQLLASLLPPNMEVTAALGRSGRKCSQGSKEQTAWSFWHIVMQICIIMKVSTWFIDKVIKKSLSWSLEIFFRLPHEACKSFCKAEESETLMPSFWCLVPFFKSLLHLFILSFFIQDNNLKKNISTLILLLSLMFIWLWLSPTLLGSRFLD